MDSVTGNPNLFQHAAQLTAKKTPGGEPTKIVANVITFEM